MISLQQMKYLVALEEHRHFQQASEACFVTQPTLSMQIKKAEDELGFAVFDRSAHDLRLTPFGEDLLPVLRSILHETEKIEMLRQKRSGQYVERLKIGIIPTVSAYLVNDLFRNWRKEFRDLQVTVEEFRTENLLEALRRKEIDCGILAGPVVSENLRVVPLFTEEIRAYTGAGGEKVSSKELAVLKPWLLNEGNCLRNQMIRFCGLEEGDESNWDYSGGNLDILMEMVDQNGGYTLVPEHYLRISRHRPEYFKTIYSAVNGQIPARQIVCAFHTRTYKLPGIEKIIRSLQLHYSEKRKASEFTILPWK